jgi:hypothetical protein
VKNIYKVFSQLNQTTYLPISTLVNDPKYSQDPKPKLSEMEGNIFVLVEAKHHINRDKIATKLAQFDKMRAMFKVRNNVLAGMSTGVHPSFLKALDRHPLLGSILESYLFFGAAFWDKGLLQQLQDAIKRCKFLTLQFSKEKDSTKKIKLYNELCTLERQWYQQDTERTGLDEEAIIKLESFDSGLNYVECIVHSGDRYKVAADIDTEDSESNMIIFAGGGGKTRKLKRGSGLKPAPRS